MYWKIYLKVFDFGTKILVAILNKNNKAGTWLKTEYFPA